MVPYVYWFRLWGLGYNHNFCCTCCFININASTTLIHQLWLCFCSQQIINSINKKSGWLGFSELTHAVCETHTQISEVRHFPWSRGKLSLWNNSGCAAVINIALLSSLHLQIHKPRLFEQENMFPYAWGTPLCAVAGITLCMRARQFRKPSSWASPPLSLVKGQTCVGDQLFFFCSAQTGQSYRRPWRTTADWTRKFWRCEHGSKRSTWKEKCFSIWWVPVSCCWVSWSAVAPTRLCVADTPGWDPDVQSYSLTCPASLFPLSFL